MDNIKEVIKKENPKEVKSNEYLLKENEREVRQYFIKLENKAQNYFFLFFRPKYEKVRSKIFMVIIKIEIKIYKN